MRKVVLMLLVLALICPLAAQAASKLNTALIDDAKQALALMSYGEYKKAVKKLGFGSASELKDFVNEELTDLPYAVVQTDVAVAYYAGSSWRVAVPIEEPSYDSVQALVLRSKDGQSFDAYRVMYWHEVNDAVSSAEKVVWQDAYTASETYLATDA